jgi:hypothetical protein
LKDKKILPLIILILSFTFSTDTYAIGGTDRKFGAGIMTGTSTGITFKHWFKDPLALDFYLSFSSNKVEIHSDFLMHKKNLIKLSKESLTLSYGAGVKLLNKDNGKDQVGIRAPLGLNYYFKDFSSIPVGIFIELTPVLNIVTETDLDIDAFVGARYYF